MILKNKELEINICDFCDKSPITRVSKGICIVCLKHFCASCEASSFMTEGWLPYDLRGQYFFCADCWKNLGKMNQSDYTEVFGEKCTSSYPKDQFNKWAFDIFQEAKQEVKNKISERLKMGIERTSEKYRAELKEDERKQKLRKELEEINKKKQDLENKLNT